LTLAAALVGALLASCSGPPRFTAKNGGFTEGSYDGESLSVDRRRLREICTELTGTRYRYGGADGRGFDCSGLVGHVYREYNGMKLPRTVRELFRIGRPVADDRFDIGDLLFYNTDGRGPSHVGIYLGNSTFLHASSSDGVVVSDVDEGYYARRYLGARRILP
jgi:cell wall-associated NlpC family hydrolase